VSASVSRSGYTTVLATATPSVGGYTSATASVNVYSTGAYDADTAAGSGSDPYMAYFSSQVYSYTSCIGTGVDITASLSSSSLSGGAVYNSVSFSISWSVVSTAASFWAWYNTASPPDVYLEFVKVGTVSSSVSVTARNGNLTIIRPGNI
jgi:hypothetical protein